MNPGIPDPTPTLTGIAAAIRQHSPGAVPESLILRRDGALCVETHDLPDAYSEGVPMSLPDDIVRHVLMAAMMLDYKVGRRSITRQYVSCAWEVTSKRPYKGSIRTEVRTFEDSDHYNDPLLSLYEAWRWRQERH